MEEPDEQHAAVAAFAFELGVLKRIRRAGWWHVGVRDPESVAEYEAQQTPEARCAKDADKLDCLIQAIEYQDAGYARVQGWIDSSRSGLRTDSARRIADAALRISPLAWRGR